MSRWLRSSISINLLLLAVILPAHALAAPPDQKPRMVPSVLHDRALAEGEVRVLVELALPSGRVAESALAVQARAAYRQEITDTGSRVLSRLAQHQYRGLLARHARGRYRRRRREAVRPAALWRRARREHHGGPGLLEDQQLPGLRRRPAVPRSVHVGHPRCPRARVRAADHARLRLGQHESRRWALQRGL